MTKLNSLLNYLIKNSFYKEASYLFKLANNQNPEDYLQENYLKIYEVFLNDRKPAAAYINIINQLRNKGYSDEDINALNINNFQELVAKLKEEKADPKKEFFDEVYKKLKEVEVNISDEELLYAKEKGLTPEEIIFLVKDKTAHPFSAKVDWAFKFNQNKHKHEDLRDKKITDYQNIDEVDRALTDKITYSEEYMKDFYVGIKSKAEETSEVIYNSLNYVVAHSMSKEAAQWWEQSCVSYNSKTKTVDAGLCTAKHEGNLYDQYYSDGYLVQIITKSSPSSSTSPKTNFKDKNYSWNLISLHIYGNGELSREYGSTVNSLNQDVTPCEIKDALGDEYNKIIEAISDYFNKLYDTQISGFDCKDKVDAPNILKLIKKDELNERDIEFLKDLSSEDYFDYKLDIKFKKNYPKIFDINYRDIVKDDPKIYFENNLGKYRNENPEYLELFENALNKLNASSYFEYALDEKHRDENLKYFNIFEKKLKEINSEDYFQFKLDEKYGQEYPEILKENLNYLYLETYFYLKFDEKYGEEFPEILKNKLQNISKSFYFKKNLDEKYAEKFPLIHISKNSLLEYFQKKFDEKYPEGLPKPNDGGTIFYQYPDNALIPIKDLLKELYPDDYFELKLDEKYKEIYPDVFEKNLNKINSEDYFHYKLDEKYDQEYPEMLKENLNFINSKDYFEFKLDEKYAENYPLIHISKHTAEEYFEKKLDEKYGQEYPEILKENLKRIDAKKYFEFKLDEKYGEEYGEEYWKILESNLYQVPFEYFYYRLVDDKFYKGKYLEIFKKRLNEINPFLYFYDKLDEKHGEYTDVLETKLNQISPDKYFELGLDKKYDGEKYFDILKNNLSKIDSSLYFEFKLDEKYGEKYPDILTAQTVDYNYEYGDE